jgi:ABC-type glutathione transport system ATPase component
MSETILAVKNISKCFSLEQGIFARQRGRVLALDGVDFSLQEFDTLGIVGESGSGKTTLAKIILKLILPDSGKLFFNPDKIRNFRKDIQIIFQNPYSSLNPKMRILDIISEPLLIHRIVSRNKVRGRVAALLEMVELENSILQRFPIEFSGGQRQRICIARALASEPKFIVLDEPISSLDLTVQARILDLFLSLKDKFRLTYIFISHNLAVIKHLADRVLVMQNGKVLEEADSREIFSAPRHPYTRLLLESARS